MYGNRYDWQRQRADQERTQRIHRLDWTKYDDVKWRLDDLYGDSPMNVDLVRNTINAHLSNGPLTAELALKWIAEHNSRHHERLMKECMRAVTYEIKTHEQRVAIMNNPRLFALVPEHERRRIADGVLENSDLSELGVSWFGHFPHLSDFTRYEPVRKAMEQTHAVEFLLEGGDATVRRIDAWILDRLEKGLGAPDKASKLTGEFFAAIALIGMEGMPKHEVVQMASEAILKMVGEMPWRSRTLNFDESRRTAHEQLKVLDWLISRIAGVMTDENAGLVLRWARGSKRHHNWVRDRLTKAAELHGWLLVPVDDRLGEPAATWKTGGRTYYAFQAADPENIGELAHGGWAWVPRTRYLGDPVESTSQVAKYRAPIHPATAPTDAMREDPSLFPL